MLFYKSKTQHRKFLSDPIINTELLSFKVDDFMSYVNQMTKGYRSNNVLITMGEDFNYQDAGMWYKNLDKLIL